MVEETTLNQAWGALRAELRDAFSFYDIKEIVGLAGIDMTRLAGLVQRAGGGASKGQLMTALDIEISELDHRTKSRMLSYIAEEIIARRVYDQSERLEERLRRLGWQVVDGKLIPIELFDIAELAELPDAARTDLVKAAARLRDGDLSGALAAACAAVDSATGAIYAAEGLGPSSKDSFQECCAKALKARGTMSNLAVELDSLGWDPAVTQRLVANLQGALNQGAYVMQTLRSGMSDVHGSKPVMNSLVFDSLKWAALIVLH